MPADTAFMDKLVALCKRRGFIYQSSEIYGGIGGFWDYGPLGVELKRNIKNLWWHDMVTNPPLGPDGHEVEMVGVDCSIIMNPKVWEASGHATGFADPMVDDKETKERFRADQLFGIWVLVADGPRDIVVGGVRQALHEGRFVPPAATVIASSEGEAFALATEPRKISWGPSILSQPGNLPRNLGKPRNVVEFDVALTRGGKVADWSYDDGHGNRFWAFLHPIARDVLMNTPDQVPSPFTGNMGALTQPRQFNLMFKTHYGAVEDAASVAFLRPETAQGIFANFKNVLDTSRVKVPFGIGQVGKAFRNEINPRNYTFRSREFEQMEIEFFCHEAESMQWYEFWRSVRFNWYVNLGLKSEKLRLRDQGPEELAHYSKACADIEYLFPFSDDFQELEGVAHRGNFDLRSHVEGKLINKDGKLVVELGPDGLPRYPGSGKDLTYFDDEAWERDRPNYGGDKEKEKVAKNAEPYRFLPTVIEPSAGADRATLAFLCEAYCEDQAPDEKGVMQTRVVMKFHPKLAPIKVAVFPLVKKEGMPEIAEAIYKEAKKHVTAFYDDKGAVGRRYRRQDEAGTPFCVTVDGQTLQDGTVTIRDRDTLQQVRVHKDAIVAWLQERLAH